jgi:oligopeptide/dipeptide ABC transporter ATP-binding protein
MTERLLELEGIRVEFPTKHGVVSAVDGVSLVVGRNEAVGIVGESGSGKSTLGRVALRLQPLTGGRVTFAGQDITSLRGGQLRALRRRFQMVLQDPLASLNPRMSVGDIVGEPLRALLGVRGAEQRARVAAVIDRVHLPAHMIARYPHELSGGQAQRVGIARALIVQPDFVVADEPVSSLDASVAAQIMALLAELKAEEGIAYLVISHDLSLVRHLCERVAVMYLGRIVEEGPAEQIFRGPSHPYTAALLSATPGARGADGTRRTRIVLSGDLPDPTAVPSGCRFRTRCPIGPMVDPSRVDCIEIDPILRPSGHGRAAACRYTDEVDRLVNGATLGAQEVL